MMYAITPLKCVPMFAIDKLSGGRCHFYLLVLCRSNWAGDIGLVDSFVVFLSGIHHSSF